MSPIDIAVTICIIPAVIGGYKKGFIEQVCSFLAIILGIWAAFHFSQSVEAEIARHWQINDALLSVISFATILITVSIVFALASALLTKLFKLIMLNWVNRLLGILLSIAECIILIGIVIILFESLNSVFELASRETLSKSVTYYPIRDFVYFLFPYLKGLLAS